MTDDPNPRTLTNRGLTVIEASKKTGISVATIRRWCVNGKLEATKFGERLWLIEPRSLKTIQDHDCLKARAWNLMYQDAKDVKLESGILLRTGMDRFLDSALSLYG